MNHFPIPCSLILLCLACAPSAGQDASRVPIESVTASSDLPTKYAVSKATDGDAETHWAARNVLPQWIRIEFAGPVRVDTLRILGVSAQKIYDNWRRVTVSFSDGTAFGLILPDAWQWQTIRFPAREASWIKVTIESTYKTTHYVGCEEIEAHFTRHDLAEAAVEPKPDASRPQPGAARAWQPTESDRKLLSRLAPAPSVRREHPNLWVNAEDIERAKHRIRTQPWAFAYFMNRLATADTWAAKSDDEIRRLVPAPYAVFDNKVPCPDCGTRLVAGFDRPGKAYCPKCKAVFPNERYPDDGRGWKNPKTGKVHYFVGLYNDRAIWGFDHALQALADVYALTGEEKFARAASVLFDALAVIYPTCDKGPKWYPGVGGRLNRPFYQAARALILYADEYDLLYHSPEWEKPSINPKYKTRRRNFEENFMGNAGEYCYTQILKASVKSLNNGYCDYLQGAVAAGRVLGIERYLDYALESEMSIFNFIENTIDRDGQYFETAFMYSSHALDLFSHHAEMLRYYTTPKFPGGINLYDHPKLKLAFMRSERDIDCAGHIPPLGDTGPDLRVIRESERQRPNRYVLRRLEYLAARAGDPKERARFAAVLSSAVRDVDRMRPSLGMTRWLVFNAASVPEEPSSAPAASEGLIPTTSTLLAGARGIGILRAGPGGDTAALLRWGPTLNHGSPDEMNINLFAHGREITYDPGYLWAHMRAGWTHATGSHNLVVVNEKNQLSRPGSGGDLELWLEAPGVRAVSADDPLCYGEEAVSRYRRTLVLADLSPSEHYLLDIFRVTGGDTHDLNWHFVGDMRHVEGVTLPPPETTGSLAGPEYEWWKLLQPDGWLRGIEKGFYWQAPPGNGYGFIFNIQRAKAKGPCAFDWKVGERVPEPRMRFEPASHMGKDSGKRRTSGPLGACTYCAEAAGDFFEINLPVNADGEYDVVVVFYRFPQGGIVQASLDDRPVGGEINTYSPVEYLADPLRLGTRRMAAGLHRLRFTVRGKDPESRGFQVCIAYATLDTAGSFGRSRSKVDEIVRLNLLPDAGTDIIVGRAKGAGDRPDATYVISRRKGRALSSCFISLVEPCLGEPHVTSVKRMQPAGGAKGVAAVRIATRDGLVDYVFESVAPAAVDVYACGEERVRFGGRFGVARTRGGKVTALVLHGSGEIETGGKRLRADGAEYGGKVAEVDMRGCAVYTDRQLPADGSLDGCVVQFSNPAYSRRSPFLVRRVAREGGRTRIELEAASLVMARGLVGKEAAPAGVIPNIVPLDRERMVKRGFRTMYFQGKRIVGDGGEDWGRVKDVSVGSWYVTSTAPIKPQAGKRFSIVEVSPGDDFTILRTTVETF